MILTIFSELIFFVASGITGVVKSEFIVNAFAKVSAKISHTSSLVQMSPFGFSNNGTPVLENLYLTYL